MSLTITIETKSIGQNNPELQGWPLTIKKDLHGCTLKDLITSVVREEAAEYNHQEQHANRLYPVLSFEKIEEGRVAGKVIFGGRSIKPTVDMEYAVDKALTSFHAGHYFVFVDNVQVENLDDMINISENSKAIFLRLTPLVGGGN